METLELTLKEKIERAAINTNQTSIVRRMVESGCQISEVQFSRKKNGHSFFTQKEKKSLEKILEVKIF